VIIKKTAAFLRRKSGLRLHQVKRSGESADEKISRMDSTGGKAMPIFDDPQTYRGILESLPVGLCVLNLEKKVVLWSDGAERITGRRRHEVLGHSCIGEALLYCDQQDCEWCNEDCPSALAMRTSQPIEALGFVHHRAGHEIPVRAFAVPVRNGHGSIVGAVEVFADLKAVLPEQQQSAHPAGSVDELTGLDNRVMMQARLREALITFNEMRVPFSVLRFRVEGLDRFHHAFGPDAVSSLLRVIARTLEATLWKTDFVGRWSDDEFLAILNSCRQEVLPVVRERLRRVLASSGIEWWGERRSLPISVAQASVQPDDTLEILLERVQQSLQRTSLGVSKQGSEGGPRS
jgi:diguanylate cyclase (GGDEF)-like protein/PAS domain S-box-containing protein